MKCRAAAAIIEDFREGTLDPHSEPLLLEHLGECHTCRQILTRLDAIDGDLRSAMPALEPSAGFADRVSARTREVSRPRPQLQPWLRPALAAACLLIAVSAWVFAPRPASRPAAPKKTSPTAGTTATAFEPAATEPHAVGRAFTVEKDNAQAYDGKTSITIVRMDKGIPQLLVDAFPRD